ncbi:hypothetical protein GWI33_013735 [Rhynchophorus ferrugineus]|uniref:Uncharacterized protein n=1 Tax=Rhynchophorus ferrugineus TaxID=354439 RepID=A0A834I7K0_RHYFE|nr:hypothetical protein GWI33_013735 [Rhynchophorus ferrugineus]
MAVRTNPCRSGDRCKVATLYAAAARWRAEPPPGGLDYGAPLSRMGRMRSGNRYTESRQLSVAAWSVGRRSLAPTPISDRRSTECLWFPLSFPRPIIPTGRSRESIMAEMV